MSKSFKNIILPVGTVESRIKMTNLAAFLALANCSPDVWNYTSIYLGSSEETASANQDVRKDLSSTEPELETACENVAYTQLDCKESLTPDYPNSAKYFEAVIDECIQWHLSQDCVDCILSTPCNLEEEKTPAYTCKQKEACPKHFL